MTRSNFVDRFVNSSSNCMRRRTRSMSTSSLIRSLSVMRSCTTSCESFTLLLASTAWNASTSENSGTCASGAIPVCTLSSTVDPRKNTSRPATPRAARSAPACLYFWYSRRRRISASRGSSSSSASASSSWPGGGAGRSIFDLMCASVAAITRYSLARSRSSSWKTARYSRYFSVTKPIGMSRMSSSCFWQRCRSRSSGPSNVGKDTE